MNFPPLTHLAFLGCIVVTFPAIGIANDSSKDDASKPTMVMSVVGNNAMPTNIVKPGSRWNFGPGSLWTHRGWQYAAYWDDKKQVSVARRQLPNGNTPGSPWSVLSLPGYQRTDNIDRGKGGKISRGFGDGHEKVAMGISDDGYLHLSFDHHLSTLRYRHSLQPIANAPETANWNAEAFSPVLNNLGRVSRSRNSRNRRNAAGPKIESVTYPSFVTADDSLFLYLRLGGGSGSANSHLFRYRRGRWLDNQEPTSQFIDKAWSGGDKTVNAYPFGIQFHKGRLHITWCWRDTPDSTTSHDLCYAYSDDLGVTWRNNDGAMVAKRGTHFITADTPGITAMKIQSGNKYRNGGSMAVDQNGRVHVLARGEDGSPTHYQRDPATGKWTRQSSSTDGALIPGANGAMFIVSHEGLYQMPVSNSGEAKLVANGKPELFEDCKMGIDKARPSQDGWLSVMGQINKKVTVIDYWVGKPSPKTD
ncbi:hypothetical protein LF1_43470 [Rubripirellula obstinata]|uniref:Sialidase domain-containing protein n=1 Tax=Rubripirellula obstinata TaxID=406547 RepID=A0A5B1CKQ7_9BACT|nr:BNR repeat-containing protein [Rubripirellula obstinata]KAA1261787.1 hypothetical protein LF1_43470 [Rubripirellula obstinata]